MDLIKEGVSGNVSYYDLLVVLHSRPNFLLRSNRFLHEKKEQIESTWHEIRHNFSSDKYAARFGHYYACGNLYYTR